jgi:exopolyphosphatase/guanosine-5'-triphosphate,3'-diphosphate pyrophosphatase
MPPSKPAPVEAKALSAETRIGLRLAAIDIGSNAVRLLISDVTEKGRRVFLKENTRVRVPLRLGRETFAQGELSAATQRELTKTLRAFVQLVEVMNVDGIMACGTAALREAGNRSDVLRAVKAGSGLEVRIITGAQEAEFIFSTYMNELPFRRGSFLFFDIGGGSTEVAFYQGGALQAARSFPLGTVRISTQGAPERLWVELRAWLKEEAGRLRSGKWMGVGSGGNVKEIARLSHKKTVSLKRVEGLRDELAQASLEARCDKFGLSRERAEVIVPAARIMAFVLAAAGVDKLHVPKIGLLEGIVSRLYWDRKGQGGGRRSHIEYRWM